MARMSALLNRFILCLLATVLCLSTPLRADDDDKPKGHLSKGMTKVQVRKMYGDPDGTSHHDDGETWTYVKDKAKAFIPFAGGPKVIVVTFDTKGKVVKFTSDD